MMYKKYYHKKTHQIDIDIPKVLSTMVISPQIMIDIDERIQQKLSDMKQAKENMKLGIKYSSRSLGGHTTQYRKLCKIAGIQPVILTQPKIVTITPNQALETPIITVGKPCRYKACKGRNHALHGEKCPVASSRGKTGGKNGQGDSKKRHGETNGNFKNVRPCGCPMRQHKKSCPQSRFYGKSIFRDDITFDTKLNHERNLQAKKLLNISWLSEAISTQTIPSGFLKSLDGVCGCCNKTMNASKASKVHRSDVNTQNPVRIICDACEA